MWNVESCRHGMGGKFAALLSCLVSGWSNIPDGIQGMLSGVNKSRY